MISHSASSSDSGMTIGGKLVNVDGRKEKIELSVLTEDRDGEDDEEDGKEDMMV
jgi:hypothetical protein